MDALIEQLRKYHQANPYYRLTYEIGDDFGEPHLIEFSDWKELPETREPHPLVDWISIEPKSRYTIYPLPAPATLEEIEAAEQELGFNLPGFLRNLYLNLANGGFGPRILGLRNGWSEWFGLEAENAVSLHLQNKKEFAEYGNLWEMQLKYYLPIAYGGCEIYYFLDCKSDNGFVLERDMSSSLDGRVVANSLSEWLQQWLTQKEEDNL